MPKLVDMDLDAVDVIVSTLFITPFRLQEEPQTTTPRLQGNRQFHTPLALSNASMSPISERNSSLESQAVTAPKFFAVTQLVKLLSTTQHGHEEVITLNVAPVGNIT